MKKKSLFITLICFACFPLAVSAAVNWYSYHVLPVWSVDSGKHLDWSGSTVYSSNWNAGVNTWNNYKSGVIRKDTILTENDLTISDVSSLPSNVVAVTTQYGSGHLSGSTIKFSTSKMNKLTTAKKNIVCTHEIGHALGLDENNDNGTSVVMYNVISNNTSNNVLHSEDKFNYDYMYNNKY